MSHDNEEKALVLGREKVSTLLWKYSLPAIAAMVASSLYNIIAGIFIGHLGAYAISGVGLTTPFMNLSSAFGALVGVGGSVLCSISLGEKNYFKARQTLANVVILNVIIGAAFTILSLIFLDPILIFFGASENTIGYAREYMRIILLGNVFAHMYLGLNSVLRVSGSPVSAMLTTFLSVLINLVLAPIFIFAMDLGVKGAALATVIAQVACCMTVVAMLMDKNRPVYFEREAFRFRVDIVRRSFAIGSPNFFTNAAGCFIIILQNQRLLEYGGDLYVGAFSIMSRVSYLFFMIVLGFSQGMQPVVGYNFGAGQYPRMWQAFRITMACALCVTVACTLCSVLIPREMTSLFVDGSSPLDIELVDITTDGFRIYNACFWIIATQVIGSNFFACISQPGKSLFLSLTRQVFFIIPILLILPPVIGVRGVWIASPVSDVAAALIAAFLIHREYRRQKGLGYLGA